mmetsp:Transcript_25712/g.42243  ORF Transcript_25712/g.42243 Transcript_25712/m.42243 type:complete len:547 (+) Transcript_25712:69-1709(+)|eukprot:CAMPEP_0184351532 /NCGR_PEP_ID=MMETSP1089-20130417/43688_1 /TAXON_ID=38269 ORGANISM="Gloeochaete wittrockiana, Strain SAG46.84" /NCGR_SAMPLE_ID=MMETSP1089 /ASSEMBLY_ACC=CAM_ASM_000445 /LENGTH=546 /DNA_ID=CAMNT_0026684913 /DNA_START=47 /DNA_END=1687 /DNA_ORIENTATION=-
MADADDRPPVPIPSASSGTASLWAHGFWDVVKAKSESILSTVTKDLNEFVTIVDEDVHDVAKKAESAVKDINVAELLQPEDGVRRDFPPDYNDPMQFARAPNDPEPTETELAPLLAPETQAKAEEVVHKVLDSLDKIEGGLEKIEDHLEASLSHAWKNTADFLSKAVAFKAPPRRMSRPSTSTTSPPPRAVTTILDERQAIQFGYAKQNHKIVALQSDPATYTDDPQETEEYANWCSTFDIAAKTEEIDFLLRTHLDMQSLHTRIVPAIIPYRQFWQRYFYRLEKLKKEEERRAAIVKRATNAEEESFSWDADDDADSQQSLAPLAPVTPAVPENAPPPPSADDKGEPQSLAPAPALATTIESSSKQDSQSALPPPSSEPSLDSPSLPPTITPAEPPSDDISSAPVPPPVSVPSSEASPPPSQPDPIIQPTTSSAADSSTSLEEPAVVLSQPIVIVTSSSSLSLSPPSSSSLINIEQETPLVAKEDNLSLELLPTTVSPPSEGSGSWVDVEADGSSAVPPVAIPPPALTSSAPREKKDTEDWGDWE